MPDQANDLRRLIRHCAPREASASGDRPKLVVVTSGKGGVGTTTVAVNLAVAMARGGLRTVLVDADPCGGDAAVLCGLEPRYTLADVLAARRTVRQVLQPGPGAVEVLPGAWGLERLSDYPPAAGERLLGELQGLGGQTDLLMLDAGNHPNRMIQRFWQAADLILVVTTPETSSIIDTYASIKALAEGDRAGPIYSLVNLAPSAEVAEDVQGRLAQACRRFLGTQLTTAGHVPPDPHLAGTAAAGEPCVIAAPGCAATRQMVRVARRLAGAVVDGKTPKPPVRTGKRQETTVTV